MYRKEEERVKDICMLSISVRCGMKELSPSEIYTDISSMPEGNLNSLLGISLTILKEKIHRRCKQQTVSSDSSHFSVR